MREEKRDPPSLKKIGLEGKKNSKLLTRQLRRGVVLRQEPLPDDVDPDLPGHEHDQVDVELVEEEREEEGQGRAGELDDRVVRVVLVLVLRLLRGVCITSQRRRRLGLR